jgi:hypothetical protein
MRRIKWACFGIALAALAATGVYLPLAQDATDQELAEEDGVEDVKVWKDYLKRLKGLRGVYVVVREMGPPGRRSALEELGLRTAVELRLRRASVPVLGRREWQETPGRAYLNVTVVLPSADRQPNVINICDIIVSLEEQALLVRNPAIGACCVDTWSASINVSYTTDSNGHIVKPDLTIVQPALRIVDLFANLYLSANTPQRSTTRPTE